MQHDVEDAGHKGDAPESGGSGEGKRADFLQKLLEGWGFKVSRYTYLDGAGTKRPNLFAVFGNGKKTLWIITHMDTVSEGDRSLWKTDPFKAKISGGKIYGRGSNDDGQEVIASIFALKALKDSGARTKLNFGIAIAADEETSSNYGMAKLVDEKLFGKEDLYVVPDFGTEKGDEIEVAEKGMLWLRVSVKGKQVHASTPEEGENAYRHSIRFLAALDDLLHKKYDRKNRLFPNASTFEMTKHEKNVDSVKT